MITRLRRDVIAAPSHLPGLKKCSFEMFFQGFKNECSYLLHTSNPKTNDLLVCGKAVVRTCWKGARTHFRFARTREFQPAHDVKLVGPLIQKMKNPLRTRKIVLVVPYNGQWDFVRDKYKLSL